VTKAETYQLENSTSQNDKFISYFVKNLKKKIADSDFKKYFFQKREQ